MTNKDTNLLELDEFIKMTLVQISMGINKANKSLHEKGVVGSRDQPFQLHKNFGDEKMIPGIVFDIAVTAADTTSKEANGKISVLQTFNIGGNVKDSKYNNYAHRIKFSVGLSTNLR